MPARLAAVAAALALVLGGAACDSDEDGREPAPPAPAIAFAMNVNRTFELAPKAASEALRELRRIGVSAGRADAFWASAEPRRPDPDHSYDWFVTDLRAELLARAGLRWLPIVAYSAPWASSVPGSDKGAPRDPADFAAYASALVRRYGPDGDFWSQRPDLPRLPVLQWEVWNEPNFRGFWHPRPDAAAYARLYLVTARAIHRADPGAVVVVGGLGAAERDAAGGFVREMLAAEPGIREQIDGIGYHPYGARPAVALRRLRRFTGDLDELGLAAVPLYLNEFGWPTRGARSAEEPLRARYFRELLDGFAAHGERVRQLAPYTWTLAGRDPDEREDWFALRSRDGISPSGRAYERFIREWRSRTAESEG